MTKLSQAFIVALLATAVQAGDVKVEEAGHEATESAASVNHDAKKEAEKPADATASDSAHEAKDHEEAAKSDEKADAKHHEKERAKRERVNRKEADKITAELNADQKPEAPVANAAGAGTGECATSADAAKPETPASVAVADADQAKKADQVEKKDDQPADKK